MAWEGHQEYLLSGGSWGAEVEQLVWVCVEEENECTFKMNCTSHARSRKVTLQLIYIHVWQSQVEIERYSVAYFGRTTAFEVL